MKEIPLKDYCSDHTQGAAADIIGCTQGAVWQMLKDKREIYIVLGEASHPTAYEKKQLSKHSKQG